MRTIFFGIFLQYVKLLTPAILCYNKWSSTLSNAIVNFGGFTQKIVFFFKLMNILIIINKYLYVYLL